MTEPSSVLSYTRRTLQFLRWWTNSRRMLDEDQFELYSHCAKLFRRRDRDLEWEERDHAKLLLHKKSDKIRFSLRDERTTNIVGNFHVVGGAGYCELTQFAGSERGWIWWAFDCSDGEPKAEAFLH